MLVAVYTASFLGIAASNDQGNSAKEALLSRGLSRSWSHYLQATYLNLIAVFLVNIESEEFDVSEIPWYIRVGRTCLLMPILMIQHLMPTAKMRADGLAKRSKSKTKPICTHKLPSRVRAVCLTHAKRSQWHNHAEPWNWRIQRTWVMRDFGPERSTSWLCVLGCEKPDILTPMIYNVILVGAYKQRRRSSAIMSIAIVRETR